MTATRSSESSARSSRSSESDVIVITRALAETLRMVSEMISITSNGSEVARLAVGFMARLDWRGKLGNSSGTAPYPRHSSNRTFPARKTGPPRTGSRRRIRRSLTDLNIEPADMAVLTRNRSGEKPFVMQRPCGSGRCGPAWIAILPPSSRLPNARRDWTGIFAAISVAVGVTVRKNEVIRCERESVFHYNPTPYCDVARASHVTSSRLTAYRRVPSGESQPEMSRRTASFSRRATVRIKLGIKAFRSFRAWFCRSS